MQHEIRFRNESFTYTVSNGERSLDFNITLRMRDMYLQNGVLFLSTPVSAEVKGDAPFDVLRRLQGHLLSGFHERFGSFAKVYLDQVVQDDERREASSG